jgi:hypothetical protein
MDARPSSSCQEAGKKLRPPLSMMLYAYVLADGDRGIEAARDLVAFYASAPAYSKLFSSIGYARESKAMMDAWQARDRNRVRQVLDRRPQATS